MMVARFIRLSSVTLAIALPGSRWATCSAQDTQEPVRPYTAFDAAADSYARNEALRQRDLHRQIGVIQYLRWWNGVPMTLPLSRPFPPDRASFYAYGGLTRTWHTGVFELWPYLPGDIWGYSYDDAVVQSVGRREVQAGPGRWESQPIYAPPSPAARSTGPRAY
jgi:hypothetical protein